MTMSDQKQDQEFQDYLNGNSEMSRAYRKASGGKTPQHLDDYILAAARKSVGARPRLAYSPFSKAWQVPVSVAAVLVLSVGLVFTLQEQTGEGKFSGPGPESGMRLQERIDAPADMEFREEVASPAVAAERHVMASQDADMNDMFADEAVQEADARTSAASAEPPQPRAAAKLPAEKAAALVQDAPLPAAEATGLPTLRHESRNIGAQSPPPKATGRVNELQGQALELKDEIAELEQSRKILESETTSLEQDLERNRQKHDDLKKQAARLTTIMPAAEITGSRAEVSWLSHIRRVWRLGQNELARENLRDFKQAHPRYPVASLRQIFPEDLYLEIYTP